MDLFTIKDHPVMLESVEDIKEQNKLNIDSYTKFKRPLTPIQSFYAGKSVFLTGATGFLGICLVEKVLRDCSDIKKLYLLVRSRKSGTVENRMKKYFSSVVFGRLRKINQNFENKIVIINGDLGERNLGLSAEDRQLLIDNIDIIIHNGASVKFKERINVALKINVLGTKNMLELALACKNIKAFVYVSTAYSHDYRKRIQDEFYEPPVDLEVVHDMIAVDQTTKDGLSDESCKSFFGKWANIYTFTKSIAEDLVKQYSEKAIFACSIYRPSMVTSAYKEPLIGWIGNKLGPNIVFLGIGIGVIHVLFDTYENLDIVPVDYCVNALITCIYDAARQWEYERSPKVYNFGSSMTNPITPRKIYYYGSVMAPTIGTKAAVWHMSTIFTSNKWLFLVLHFFLHCIPAIFADAFLLAMGKKPRALNICILATKNIGWISHFMTFGWQIQVSEMRRVFDTISESDRKLFNFDIWNLNWENYSSRMFLGCKIHLVKDSLDNIKKSKQFFNLLRILHNTLLAVFYFIVAYYVLKLFSIIN